MGILIFKGLTARRLYKSFGVKGLNPEHHAKFIVYLFLLRILLCQKENGDWMWNQNVRDFRMRLLQYFNSLLFFSFFIISFILCFELYYLIFCAATILLWSTAVRLWPNEETVQL
jgi:hypothetical protein